MSFLILMKHKTAGFILYNNNFPEVIIMHYCPNCRVSVAGVKRCCPLCGGPLEGDGDASTEVFPLPDKPHFSGTVILRLLALVLISATAICILVNMAVTPHIWWSLFVAAGSFCAFVTTAVGFAYHKDIYQNIGWQTVLIPALGIVWDFAMGWQGWSLSFVLPCTCAAALLTILLLTILLRSQLSAFASPLLSSCVIGLIPGILAALNKIRVVLPSLICSGIAIILLCMMLIFHGRALREEIIRRFHM